MKQRFRLNFNSMDKMKTVKSLILRAIPTLLLLISLNAFAQEKNFSSRLRVTSAWILPGVSWQATQNGSLSDFKQLAPGSAILKGDLSGYTNSFGMGYMNTFGTDFSSQTSFSGGLGIQFLNDKDNTLRSNPTLRLGFSYRNGEVIYGTLFKETTTVIDTLTSSQTGAELYLDSTHSETISMGVNREVLMLDASVIFESHPGSRWTLFGGAGIAAGYAFNATTDIFYNNYDNVQTTVNGSPSFVDPIFDNADFKSETFRNNDSFVGEIYLPLGLDFTVGKEREFWKKIHLFYEMRPGMQFATIPNLRSVVRTQIHQGVGLKLKW